MITIQNIYPVITKNPLMRMLHGLGSLALLLVFLVSCSDKKEVFESEPITAFAPTLEPGKYITYRLDSLIFTNFGRTTEIHKYQQKHVIDSLLTDNLGRPSYRVYKYIRDSAGTQLCTPNGTYFITAVGDQLEVIEDNLRIIKLHVPFNPGFNWRGNTHLPMDPYGGNYNFSNDDDMDEWEFTYNSFDPAITINGQNYTDVWTIDAADEAYNVPIADLQAYGARTRSVEKYSKNIGMVYREHELWEYQPNPGGPGGPYKTGFGLTMWMIDHN